MSVSSVAVVGAGPKGLSIAEAIAKADLPVTVVCVTGARVEHASRRLRRTLDMRVDFGELRRADADAIAELVRFERDLGAAADADLVIESAVGDVRAKRALLATIEGRMSRGAVLASNTTRAELEAMAEVLVRRDQFLGLRFFHPATHTPLVEVMPLTETAPGALVACHTLCRWLGKTPVEPAEGSWPEGHALTES
ncbi:MAG TPA: 3-hydroxyacyl-CoA dehydrogenase NAD-binding domain-containing protein [Sandaracinaceae bacterium]